MFKYKGNVVNIFETSTKFDEIGVQRLDEMGILPIFGVYYKGHILKRNSSSLCNETQGDCFKFATKYL